MKPLCLCNCRRYPSSKLLGRRTGACLTARQWVKQSMTSGARALTQCGKKRVQMPGEPTLMWIFATSVCFWTVWLLDIFGKTCTVSVITVVLACDCDCVVSSSYTSAARHLSSMSSSSDAYTHTYMHTYIHTYLPFYTHTYLPTYIHTYVPFYLLDLSPSPLSFLPSLSPLKPLKLILGRSWLVGLSGPLIFPYIGNNNPNRLSYVSEGWLNHQPVMFHWEHDDKPGFRVCSHC